MRKPSTPSDKKNDLSRDQDNRSNATAACREGQSVAGLAITCNTPSPDLQSKPVPALSERLIEGRFHARPSASGSVNLGNGRRSPANTRSALFVSSQDNELLGIGSGASVGHALFAPNEASQFRCSMLCPNHNLILRSFFQTQLDHASATPLRRFFTDNSSPLTRYLDDDAYAEFRDCARCASLRNAVELRGV